MIEEKSNGFHLTYSPQEERTRRADSRESGRAVIVGLSLGILGVLALGLGMSCILVWDRFIPGILIGVAGMTGVVAAWPVYQWIENKK